jgi:hypothetical protein
MFGWLRKAVEPLYGADRSSKWRKVREEHLRRQPECQACGRKKDLEVHHLASFAEHPELELCPDNLWTLCGDPCHFVHGHLMDFHRCNPDCIADSKRYRDKVRQAGDLPP